MSQIYNFSAGPAMLPAQVLKQMQAELLEYGNAKASVMEISHRGKDFMAMAQKSEQDLRKLMILSYYLELATKLWAIPFVLWAMPQQCQ